MIFYLTIYLLLHSHPLLQPTINVQELQPTVQVQDLQGSSPVLQGSQTYNIQG